MYDTVKETQCTSCAHRTVCMFKNNFLSAQKAVDEIMVNLDQNRSTYLRDIPWVEPVDLKCVNYLRNQPCSTTLRGKREISEPETAAMTSSDI